MGYYACGPEAQTSKRPVVDWEEPRCLLCNSGDASILIEAPDPLPEGGGLWFAITQCQDCGLCFTNPRPSPDAISQFYPTTYPPHKSASSATSSQGWRSVLTRRGRRKRVERIKPHGQRRLLDFGCGNGSFLTQMSRRGWHVTGVDNCERTVQRIRAEHDVRVLAGTLPHPELGDFSFDVITMRHSLEHVHQPLDVLRAAHRLLAPDGQLIVATPNIDSLPFKWFGRYWRGLDVPRHLTHFTPDTLQLMLHRAGFEAGPVRTVRLPTWLRRSARLASAKEQLPFWQSLLRKRMFASLATWYAWLVRRCDAMVITAVKQSMLETDSVASFSRYESEHPRYPGGRWHNR